MAFWSALGRWGRNRDYHRGIVHYNRGEYAEAVEAFEEALAVMDEAKDPQYGLGAFYAAEARANLGLARFQGGDDARAEEDFRRALERNPGYPDLHYYVALICERTGRPKDAAAALEAALGLHPAYLEARLLFAVVLAQLGEATRARDELERCVALGFELPPGLSLDYASPLGPLEWKALRARSERRDEATRQVATAVERYEQGKRDDAIAALEKAAAAEPKFADVRCRLGTLLGEAGRYDEARAQFELALAINPRYLEARTRLGLAQLHLGRPAEAEESFVTVLEQAPDDADVRYFRAAARFLTGDLEGAEAAARESLAERPGLARAHRLRALCLTARGRHDEALESLRAALHDGRELPQAAMDLGVLLLTRGKARDAQKEFERALHWQPDTADVHYGLAQALVAGSDLVAAELRLARCLALDPEHGPARHLLGQIHLRRGRLAEARTELETALQYVPRYADVHRSLGEACEKAGDLPRAEQAYRDALAINANFTDAQLALAGVLARRGATEAQDHVRAARAHDPLHPRARAMDDRRLAELLEEGASS